jgi:hypothetical protein
MFPQKVLAEKEFVVLLVELKTYASTVTVP